MHRTHRMHRTELLGIVVNNKVYYTTFLNEQYLCKKVHSKDALGRDTQSNVDHL